MIHWHRLNYCILKMIIICVALQSLASCGPSEKTRILYDDGTVISDTNLIVNVLEEAYRLGLKKTDFNSNALIQTSLRPDFDFTPLNDSLAGVYKELMKSYYPEHISQIDSFPIPLFRSLLLVIDNSSGEIIANFENGRKIKDNIAFGMSNRLYGFILAMEKGLRAQDTFVSKSEIYNDVGEVFITKHKQDVKSLFAVDPPGIGIYPHTEFSKEDWESLATKLEMHPGFILCRDYKKDCYLESSFFDLVRTYMLIQNNGIEKNPKMIKKITGLNGKIMYSKRLVEKQTLTRQTCTEIKELLDYYKAGMEVWWKRRFDVSFKGRLFRGANSTDSGWLLYSDDSFTIGVITFINSIRVGQYGINLRHKKDLRQSAFCYPYLKTALKNLYPNDN